MAVVGVIVGAALCPLVLTGPLQWVALTLTPTDCLSLVRTATCLGGWRSCCSCSCSILARSPLFVVCSLLTQAHKHCSEQTNCFYDLTSRTCAPLLAASTDRGVDARPINHSNFECEHGMISIIIYWGFQECCQIECAASSVEAVHFSLPLWACAWALW